MALDRLEAVKEFRRAADQPIRTEPTLDIPHEEKVLALALIHEELTELAEAFDNDDLKAAADAYGDLQVVVEQLGPTLGIDGNRLFAEVHRSNMSKVDPATGKMPKNPETGKAMKGPNFFEPDIDKVLFAPESIDQTEYHDIDPRVDFIVAPSVAMAKNVIPVDHPQLTQLPAYSLLHVRRSQLLRGRHVRNIYLLPGLRFEPGASEFLQDAAYRISQSGLSGQILDLY
jgi:predicted HAD superfamily Cof-like phosphohydrolase